MNQITKKVKQTKFIILTRSDEVQHIILFGLLPFFFIDFEISSFLLYYLAFYFLNIFGFMINDYHDDGMDRLEGKKTSLSSGLISKPNLQYLSYFFLLMSLLIAFVLSPSTFWLFIIIAFLVWSYSAPPFRFKMKNWLEFPVVTLALGPLNFIYTSISIGYANLTIIFLYFIYTCLVIGQSQFVNTLKDYDVDKESGSKSLTQILGFKNSFKLRNIMRLLTPVLLTIIYFALPEKNILMVLTFLIFTIDTLLDSTKSFKNQRDSDFTTTSSIAIIILTVFQHFN